MTARQALALVERVHDFISRLPSTTEGQAFMLDLAELQEAIQTNHGAEDDGPI